jgi:hypothetical protein
MAWIADRPAAVIRFESGDSFDCLCDFAHDGLACVRRFYSVLSYLGTILMQCNMPAGTAGARTAAATSRPRSWRLLWLALLDCQAERPSVPSRNCRLRACSAFWSPIAGRRTSAFSQLRCRRPSSLLTCSDGRRARRPIGSRRVYCRPGTASSSPRWVSRISALSSWPCRFSKSLLCGRAHFVWFGCWGALPIWELKANKQGSPLESRA